MTWSFPPTNIVQDTGVSGSTNNTETPQTSVDFIVCSGFHCLVGAEFGGTTALLIAVALASIPDAYDWYTVALHVDFPAIDQGSTHCQTPPLALCPGDEGTNSFGSVNCDLVEQDNGTTVANSGGASVLHGQSPDWDIGNPSLTVTTRSLIVNPTPLFPVPDGSGDTSGAVLWTRDQLLAIDGSLAFSWNFFGIHGTSNIGVQVGISAYNDTTPTLSQMMCLL